jgi:hypothetical protein
MFSPTEDAPRRIEAAGPNSPHVLGTLGREGFSPSIFLASLRFCVKCLPVFLLLSAGRLTAAEPESRYLAVFADGARVEGQTIADWQSPQKSPRLDATPLMDPQRPLRWLLDRRAELPKTVASPPGVVEFVGGDRLPGRVAGFEAATAGVDMAVPPHLLVETAAEWGNPLGRTRRQLRILPAAVRRVAWTAKPRRQYEPGTAFCRDGRRITFRSARWERESLRLLTEDGLRRLAFSELTEIHFPAADPWRAYYEQLAILSPDLTARLVRVETAGGLVVTSSALRLRPSVPFGSDKEPDRWYHVVQPVWSFDPLWVKFPTIRARCYFAPEEVPLSTLEPSDVVQRSVFGGSWGWQVDRNVQGGPLVGSDRQYGWGLGVHAANELHFELPACVRAFQCRAGLDRAAGNGGCARAAVYVNQASGKPLFQSKVLIGSAETVETGNIALAGPGGGQKTLVLAADAVEKDAPSGADPLDIRDTLDWLEPLLLLDADKLRTEVQQYAARAIPAWNGWTASVEGGGSVPLETRWDESASSEARFVVVPGVGKRLLTLTAERQISESDNFLLAWPRPLVGEAPSGSLEVRVDGQSIVKGEVPSAYRTAPALVPLQPYRGRKVKLELVYTAPDDRQRIDWQALALVPRFTRVPWVVVTPQVVRSLGGAALAMQPDGSVLASGRQAYHEVYVFAGEAALENITAVRIEAMTDPSLPRNGPGRSSEGNFILTRFGLAALPKQPPAEERLLRGRFVRLELPEVKRDVLAKADVQVFCGTEDMAPGGKLTRGDDTQRELDLGDMKNIDQIVVWNRGEGEQARRLRDFRVQILDADRAVVWQRQVAEPPQPFVTLWPGEADDVPLHSAAADYARLTFRAETAIGDPPSKRYGWSVTPNEGLPRAAVFTLKEPLDVRNKRLVFTIEHLASTGKAAIGRFRLSVTDASPPVPAEPTVVEWR